MIILDATLMKLKGSTENQRVQLYWFHGTSDALPPVKAHFIERYVLPFFPHSLLYPIKGEAHKQVSVLVSRMMGDWSGHAIFGYTFKLSRCRRTFAHLPFSLRCHCNLRNCFLGRPLVLFMSVPP